MPITILEIRCGIGGLSRSIAEWARRRRVEVSVVAIDNYARTIHLAREKNNYKEIQFDVRSWRDPMYLQAQQFDYVISLDGLHRESNEDAVTFLKTVNRLAKRGVVIADMIRDVRAGLWMKTAAHFFRNDDIVRDVEIAVQRGFTLREISELCDKAGLKFAGLHKHFGYRLSIMGERGLVLSGAMRRVEGLPAAG